MKQQIESATLLSQEEYEKYEKMFSPAEEAWWLHSRGYYALSAARANYGYVFADGYYISLELAVRPALQISNPESLNPSEKFKFGEHTFTYLGEGLALCDDIVGKCAFREDREASNAKPINRRRRCVSSVHLLRMLLPVLLPR